MKNNSTHLLWVDSAKGIGVILIVIGHMLYDSSHDILNQLIYSFHVPMFFILSGFVFKYKGELKTKYIIRKARRLILPFLAFTLIATKRIYEAIGHIQTKELMKQIFYVGGKIFFNAPLWFLIILFEIYVVEITIESYSRGILFQLIYTIILFVCGIAISQNVSVEELNYLGFNRMVICLFFFEIGILFRRVYKQVENTKLNMRIRVFALTTITMLWYTFACKINGKVAIYSMILENYFVFILAALLGTVVIVSLCKMLFDNENLIAKLHRYSILILGLQYFFIEPFRKNMRIQGIAKTFEYDIKMLVLTLLIVVTLPLTYWLLSKKFSILKIINGEF